MTVHELVKKNRSYRRFYQGESISEEILVELVELARISPNGKNIQCLRFGISNGDKNEAIFKALVNWKVRIKEWPGPAEGEKPAAYIVILVDETRGKPNPEDAGIAAQSILLGAVEKGYNGCMFGSIKREELAKELGLPETQKIVLVVGLGKASETVIIDELAVGDENIGYYLDAEDRHHVPKRNMKDILIKFS